ncbi:MAG: tetratricopeptide repeat protein [Deltaproteobacteria bacterium]|nr:tetratricopeptide repeat protein [Deltaproteobacteria bacterium]
MRAKGGNRFDGRTTACVAALVFLVFAVYLNTLYNGFVYDDSRQIVGNPWITSARHIPDILSTHSYGFAKDNYQTISYRPVVFMMFMAEYAAFGLGRPWGWHLVSVFVHALNAVMVFFVASKLLLRHGARPDSARYLPPLAAAVIFAVHPVNSESVAWLATQPELSYTFLTLAAFYLYMRSDDAGAKGGLSFLLWYRIAPGALFFIALLFKETAVVLPALIIIHELMALRDMGIFSQARIRRYLPFAFSMAAYMLLRFWALKGEITPSSTLLSFLTGPQFALNSAFLWMQDMRMLLLPINDYPLQPLDPLLSIAEPRAIAALAVILSVPAAMVVLRKKVGALHLLALAFIALPILPTLYAPAISYFPYADRYLYLPTAGLGLLIALALRRCLRGGPSLARAAGAVLVSAAVVSSFWAASRNRIWRDDLSLWSASLEGSPDNYIAVHSIGYLNMKNGDLDQGIRDLERALALNERSAHPDAAMLLFTRKVLASAYHDRGLLDLAAREYSEVLKSEPDSFIAAYNLAEIYRSRGFFSDAAEFYKRALLSADEPAKFREVYINLGYCYYNLGLRQEALSSFTEALGHAPGDPVLLDNIRRLR